jgi:hypothetical protein
MHAVVKHRRMSLPLVTVVASGLLLAGCSSGTTTPASTSAGSQTSASAQVLPVAEDPITNSSTEPGLTISSVLVENNVNPDTNKDAADHLEIALENALTTPLSGVEVFYTIDDPTTGESESYYTDLGPDFSIPAGGERTVHFDDTGAPDHYPVNAYSLYATSTDALTITVEVSAGGVAVQTATVNKDAGGAENPDE